MPLKTLDTSTMTKLMIHWAAVALGAAALALVAAVNKWVGDPVSGVPLPYALAIGAFLGDALRVVFLELRKLDPTFDPPPDPPVLA